MINKDNFPLFGIQETPSFELGFNFNPKCGVWIHLGWHTVRFMWGPLMGALPEMGPEYENAGPPMSHLDYLIAENKSLYAQNEELNNIVTKLKQKND